MAKSNSGIKLGYVLLEDVYPNDYEVWESVPRGFTFDREVAKDWVSENPDRTFEVIPIINKPEKK